MSGTSGQVPAGGGPPGPGPAELQAELGVPLSLELLDRALTHRSFAYENGGLPTNERLEFLGDSVLGLVVTDTLFREHPDLPEGQLAKLRAAVVNMRALASVARHLDLGRHIKLGRGEEGTGGRDKSSILADTLEAIIGAVYLDRGLGEASKLVHFLFDPVIERSALLGAGLDWKTSLQELTAAEMLGVPEYQVAESGPDHQKLFRAVVRVGGRVYGSGEGRSKKEAEQQAAEIAWRAIRAQSANPAARPGGGPAGTADGGVSPAGAGLTGALAGAVPADAAPVGGAAAGVRGAAGTDADTVPAGGAAAGVRGAAGTDADTVPVGGAAAGARGAGAIPPGSAPAPTGSARTASADAAAGGTGSAGPAARAGGDTADGSVPRMDAVVRSDPGRTTDTAAGPAAAGERPTVS